MVFQHCYKQCLKEADSNLSLDNGCHEFQIHNLISSDITRSSYVAVYNVEISSEKYPEKWHLKNCLNSILRSFRERSRMYIMYVWWVAISSPRIGRKGSGGGGRLRPITWNLLRLRRSITCSRTHTHERTGSKSVATAFETCP